MVSNSRARNDPPEGMDLVSWVMRNTSYDQHMTLYIDPDQPTRSITAAEARITIRQLIAGLKAYGLKKGDCVCVHGYNDINYPLLFLAIVGAGGIFTGCNPAYTTTEVKRHLKLTRAKFLIADTDLLANIADRVIEAGIKSTRILQMSNQGQELLPDFTSWDDLLKHGEKDWETFVDHDKAKTTTAALLSTSGTSGLPKAAAHSHQSFIYQATVLDDHKAKDYEVFRLIALPVFHAFMFPLAHLLPLAQGTPTYIMRRYEPLKFLDHVYEYGITETAMVPTIITKILKSKTKIHKLLRSLRLVISAGSTLPRLTHEEFYRLLRPKVRVIQCWGMTEACWISTVLYPETDYTGSVGQLLPGFEAKLVHSDGHIITEDGVQAEIHVRGPSIMQGYLANPQATAEILDEDGWLTTGDVAYRKDGLLYIVDRKKELIKVRGWQVSPAELEGQLALHSLVNEAAVIGVPTDEGDTELPRAYLVTKPGAKLSEEDVYDYMNKHLAKYKSLEGGVRFVDAIPKNSIGKIVRRVLREVAAAEKHVNQDINIVDTSGKISMTSSTYLGERRSWTGWVSELYTSSPPTPMTDFSIASDNENGAQEADGTVVNGYGTLAQDVPPVVSPHIDASLSDLHLNNDALPTDPELGLTPTNDDYFSLRQT